MKTLSAMYSGIFLCAAFSFLSCSKTESAGPSNSLNAAGINKTYATASVVIMPGDSTVIRGDTSHGDQTALIQSRKQPYLRDNNYINFPAYSGEVWTWDGVLGNTRSLMKFSLARIPKDIQNNPPAITKALLYLYQYQRNDGLDVYGVMQTVLNEGELHRIKGDWMSNTVTWNNQPALASGSANPLEDMVIIPAVSTPLATGVQDDIVVDITDMVRRMVADNTNKGFMIKMNSQEENHPYCGRSFGSFSCPLNNKQPRLVIYY